MDWLAAYESATELYTDAQRRWPSRRSRPGGQWILASFDDESIMVYQAYNKEIAEYACAHGQFIGCPGYNEQRMTWIKTNFLWMMYRSHWASRSNQNRILAIRLRRSAFDGYLGRAVHTKVHDRSPDQSPVASHDQDGVRLKGRVRLQWDPDHYADGTPVLGRRAIQLGLRQIESFLDGRDILRIVDITSFVKNQYTSAIAPKGRRHRDQPEQLRIPIEHVYEPADEQIRRHIQLDPWEPTEERPP